MNERIKMRDDFYILETDCPVKKGFEYRNFLYTQLLDSFIEKSFDFCKKLPTENKLENTTGKNLSDLWKDDQERNILVADGHIQIEKLIFNFLDELMGDVSLDFDEEEDEVKWKKLKHDRIRNIIQRLAKLEHNLSK